MLTVKCKKHIRAAVLSPKSKYALFRSFPHSHVLTRRSQLLGCVYSITVYFGALCFYLNNAIKGTAEKCHLMKTTETAIKTDLELVVFYLICYIIGLFKCWSCVRKYYNLCKKLMFPITLLGKLKFKANTWNTQLGFSCEILIFLRLSVLFLPQVPVPRVCALFFLLQLWGHLWKMYWKTVVL